MNDPWTADTRIIERNQKDRRDNRGNRFEYLHRGKMSFRIGDRVLLDTGCAGHEAPHIVRAVGVILDCCPLVPLVELENGFLATESSLRPTRRGIESDAEQLPLFAKGERDGGSGA